MEIKKSEGTTRTEKILAQLCEKSFLKPWSYPNPVKKDTKELCDLLAVFENNVFIFFDRERSILEKFKKDNILTWERWYRKVIDSQINSVNGAERYIRLKNKIYLDKNLDQEFPIPIDTESMTVYKIIVAHGAKEACKNSSKDNVYGSLAIEYSNTDSRQSNVPFIVFLDKENPCHIFDSENLSIIFNELDTFFDFSTYLKEKEAAIKKYDSIIYCGEEDLLANYFYNFDETRNSHFIGINEENINSIFIGEGEWRSFIETEIYKRKKEEDKVSYLWDEIIQKTGDNALKGILYGDRKLFEGESAIHEMAKEPRFSRRALSAKIISAINDFPDTRSKIMRTVNLMPSFYKDKAYVFLQLKVEDIRDYDGEYRQKRRAMLEIACGAAKNLFKEFNYIIGIAIDAPKFTDYNSEDFLLLDCSNWSDENKTYYEEANKLLQFF